MILYPPHGDSSGGCPIGGAKITGGHNLPTKHILHTVAPSNKDAKALGACYANILDYAVKNGVGSIAFPCLGTSGANAVNHKKMTHLII